MILELTFDGYWRELNMRGIPEDAGIYCVYDCTQNTDNTLTLDKLIYVGESANARERIQKHEKWSEWRRAIAKGHQVCFSFAPAKNERHRAEAAIIHHHKPPLNTEYVTEFPFETTTMLITGSAAKLDGGFTVSKT